MIRLIIEAMAAHHDGTIEKEHKTFDVELPEVEQYLAVERGAYGDGGARIIGSEVIPAPPKESAHEEGKE